MWEDPIVAEVRREREAFAERFDFDVAAICRELQRLQGLEQGREMVQPPAPAKHSRTSAA